MYNGIYKQLQQGDTCWIGLDGGKFLFRDSGIYDDSVFNIKEILGYDVQLNSEMISLYRMAKNDTFYVTIRYGFWRMWKMVESTK